MIYDWEFCLKDAMFFHSRVLGEDVSKKLSKMHKN
jgi:hypothetical protein